MYEADRIPGDAVVRPVDGGAAVAIESFFAEQDESVPAKNVWQPTDKLTNSPPRRPRSRKMGGSRAVKTFFLFRGFDIPRAGVPETRDYLRATLGWLELWLKWIHLLMLLNFLSAGAFGIWLVVSVFRFTLTAPAMNWTLIYLTFATPVTILLLLVLSFVALRIFEAILRVFPAAMRYWIETTEERRMVADDAINQSHQDATGGY